MFQQPIKAQSGVYVPTIEQIMNFYQGGFDQAPPVNPLSQIAGLGISALGLSRLFG